MTPTPEQQAIVQGFNEGKTLLIEAGAGAGKSSTLKLCAQSQPNKIGTYVAYNRALADDAKRSFPRSATCKTAHALAFGSVGRIYSHRLNGPRVPLYQSTKYLEIPEQVDLGFTSLPAEHLTRVVLDSVRRFYNSADEEPGRQHVARVDPLNPEEMKALRDAAVPFMQKAWEDLQKVEEGKLRFEHDTYLKIWQLGHPHIEGDYLLLDEAQDASPVMASVFEQQAHLQRIMVGDSAQAIYGWRGAVDALENFSADLRLTLSKSFRFGPPIAGEANKWLRLLGSQIELTGFDGVTSSIEDEGDSATAVLCRTNAEAMAQCMGFLAQGKKVSLTGGGDQIRALAEAAQKLKNGEKTSHPELFLFKSWKELVDYVNTDEAASDLKTFVNLIERYGAEKIIKTLDRLVEDERAEVVVSTVHKAKGREWRSVRIANDFPVPEMDEDDNPRGKKGRDLAKDDLRLAYVATTRAQNQLNRGGLAWVDRWMEKLGLGGGK